MDKKMRVLVAKPGLDGHDVGAKIVTRALMDAGLEVIYTGLQQSPEEIIGRAIEAQVDVIGLSLLSGSHIPICRRLKVLIDQHGLQDKLWIVGGNVPQRDHQQLKDIGVDAVFSVGSDPREVATYIKTRGRGKNG